MIILTIRTDKPDAEIGLYKDQTRLAYQAWDAHRQLADTIHAQIRELLSSQQLKLEQLQGIIVYKGPGSFTGLRIGLAVANALADGLDLAIVGSTGEDWIDEGLSQLGSGTNEHIVMPEYGAEPKTTTPKH